MLGVLVLTGSLAGVVIYGWLMFFSQWAMFTLQLTVFVVVVAVLGIIAWIGYTLASTPPPEPLKRIESFEQQEPQEKGMQASQ
jgi:predicted DNA-binding transcriptional regulator